MIMARTKWGSWRRCQPGFLRRKRNTPSASLDSSISQPVVRQKCSKSLVAPGSVARTSRIPPAGTSRSARRAFSTGSGHKRPVASRVESAGAASLIANSQNFLRVLKRGRRFVIPAVIPGLEPERDRRGNIGGMTTILKILVSPRPRSHSRLIAGEIVARLEALHPGAHIIDRDLAADPPPHPDLALYNAILSPDDGPGHP